MQKIAAKCFELKLSDFNSFFTFQYFCYNCCNNNKTFSLNKNADLFKPWLDYLLYLRIIRKGTGDDSISSRRSACLANSFFFMYQTFNCSKLFSVWKKKMKHRRNKRDVACIQWKNSITTTLTTWYPVCVCVSILAICTQLNGHRPN